jgi:dipeptidase D
MEAIERVLERFEQVSAVPRGTKHEAKIREWLQEWAARGGFPARVDAAGNLVIQVPGSPGYEDKPVIILQGHMDMVWQKRSGSEHDFRRDPIHIVREGEWMRADGTTLGADNGIAIALMMAMAEDTSLAHPPLELLLTVEEEQGVGGALKFDPSMVRGKILINLDSEEDGVFTIGSAGGQTLYMELPVIWEQPARGAKFLRLSAQGLQGGHSGGDIDKQRANANKIMGRTLAYIQKEIPIQLLGLKGGTVRNAIPREAEAVLALPAEEIELCRRRVAEFEAALRGEYSHTEPGLALKLEDAPASARAASVADSERMVQFLLALPNGVAEMSSEIPGLVETSNNVGIMDLTYNGFYVVSNHRSAVSSRLEEIVARVEAIALLAGAGPQRNVATSPWRPDRNAPLLKKCVQVYRERFGEEPKVEATHGGLECAILSGRCGGLEAISLGPTIENPHSPDERLYIPSVGRTWEFMKALLAAF